MKRITCEMCGSNDLIKKDGVFVCQYCGCKYTLEEAKKLLIEGNVDVSGSTVKIDNSEELANLYKIARRAKSEDNIENAAKYYDMILIKDPNSWEAYFYSVYYKAMDCRIVEIAGSAITVSNCLNSVMELIRDYVKDSDEQEDAVMEIAKSCLNIANMFYYGAKNEYDSLDSSIKYDYTQEMLNSCCAARDILYYTGDAIDSVLGDNEEMHVVSAEMWKDGVEKHNKLMKLFENKNGNKACIDSYIEKIKKYDSDYKEPEVKTGGCYVATAVYGSYDCPQVWTLRRYRDNILAKTWYGRAFIHTYYAVSPTLVKWFGNTDWFKKMWKGRLDNMVANLNAEGVEDTPYEDINW